MGVTLLRLFYRIVIVALILLSGEVIAVNAETTFLANFNRLDQAGTARFFPDHMVGESVTVSAVSTPPEETVDLPAGTAPSLDMANRVHSGPTALDIRGGRDGLYYAALAAGNVNRGEGTAEGFFRTPYALWENTEPRTFLSAWISFIDGTRWFWELNVDSANPDRLTARFGDNSPGGGSVTVQSIPFTPEEWKANVWHHVALTWNSNGSFQLFVNGRLVGRVTNGSLPVTSATESAGGNRVYVGRRSAGTGSLNSSQGSNLEGWVDSIHLDNTVLYDASSYAVGDPVFTPPAAESWRSLGVFHSNLTVWQSSSGAMPILKVYDHRTRGYEFTCQFANVADRCYWDTRSSPNLDLSDFVSISNWVHITNASAIKGMALYFKSGDGWYRWSVQVHEGWNNFGMNLGSLGIEGTPVGLGQIELVRVSIWKQPGSTTEVKVVIYDVEARLQRAEERPFEYPEYDIPGPVRLERREQNKNRFLESRAILDEAPLYLTQGSDALLDRIGMAGFNAYMPSVWHGRGAIYGSQTAVLDPQYASFFEGSSDPLTDLIDKAHARGMEVHGWFTVALRQADIYPEFAEPGTPPIAFDLQNPAFRNFIVNEVVGFVRKYRVDGVLLDYIRTIGTSFSQTAADLYFQRYGRSIDELRQEPMPPDVRERFLEWQKDAVSDIVRRVREEVNAIRPGLAVSVYGHAQPKPILSVQGRNEWLWVENNWVDVAYDGDYNTAPDVSRLASVRRGSPYPERFSRMLGNYDRKNNTVVPRDPDLVARQVDYFIRKFPERGVGLYLYSMLSDEQVSALGTGPFKENALPFFSLRDDFDSKVTGNGLTDDARWIAYQTSRFVASALITDNLSASPNSTKSVLFNDSPGKDQIYWFHFPSPLAYGDIEFDIYVDNRNPSGRANFEVRASAGTTSVREVGLLITQPAATYWTLWVDRPGGAVRYADHIPTQTWHRIRFRNDVEKNTYSIYLNGALLVKDAPYAEGFQQLNTVNNIQWRSLGIDEDVFIDNVVVHDP